MAKSKIEMLNVTSSQRHKIKATEVLFSETKRNVQCGQQETRGCGDTAGDMVGDTASAGASGGTLAKYMVVTLQCLF